jgi:sugar lactone lactonase YvrE
LALWKLHSALGLSAVAAFATLAACGTAGSVPMEVAPPPPGSADAGDAGDDGGVPGSLTTLALVAGEPGGLGNVDATGADARFTQPWYLADDGLGHLFVSDGDAVRRVDEATGLVTTVAGIAFSVGEADGFVDGPGAAARFREPSGIACDPGGMVYVADSGNSAVRTIDAATGQVATLVRASDLGGGAGAPPFTPVGLALDGAGSLYIAHFGKIPMAGPSSQETGGAIYRVTLGGGAGGSVTLVAGSPAGAPGVVDGTGPAASFGHLRGLAYDGQGMLYAADGCAVRRIDPATGVVTTTAASACVEQLYGLASDGGGTLYAADGSSVILAVATATGATTAIAGRVGTYASVDGVGAAAAFSGPTGVAFGSDGTLHIADTGNFTVRAMVTASSAVSTLAGAPAYAEYADGVGEKARFDAPQGAAFDGAGNLYVADWNDGTVRSVEVATGLVKTLAGNPAVAGYADGIGADASFYEPTWAAYDGAGHVFVSDSGNFAIRRVDVATRTVTTVATGDYVPEGLAFGARETLYVVDSAYSSIRQVDLETGTTTVFAGTVGRGCGTANGVGMAASFCGPLGLTYDGSGNLYVTDNQTVRRIEVSTKRVTTIAGSPGVTGSVDGVGPAARFDQPSALACDGEGNLYVADGFNGTVRRIVLATGEVTTAVGLAGQYGVVLGPLASARLNGPAGLAAGPGGSLFITDIDENVVLVAR